jgi:hypothetical protein
MTSIFKDEKQGVTYGFRHLRENDLLLLTKTQAFLIESYLEFFNNYLTRAKFAEDRGIHETTAMSLLALGKAEHDKFVQMINEQKAA